MRRTAVLVLVIALLAIPWATNGRTLSVDSSSVSARAVASDTGSSGSGYVTGYTAPGASTVFTVDVPTDGRYAATLHYANADTQSNTLDILVNGVLARTAALPGTGGGTVWADEAEQLPLRAGINTVAYTYDDGNSGHVNLDWLRVSGAIP